MKTAQQLKAAAFMWDILAILMLLVVLIFPGLAIGISGESAHYKTTGLVAIGKVSHKYETKDTARRRRGGQTTDVRHWVQLTYSAAGSIPYKALVSQAETILPKPAGSPPLPPDVTGTAEVETEQYRALKVGDTTPVVFLAESQLEPRLYTAVRGASATWVWWVTAVMALGTALTVFLGWRAGRRAKALEA